MNDQPIAIGMILKLERTPNKRRSLTHKPDSKPRRPIRRCNTFELPPRERWGNAAGLDAPPMDLHKSCSNIKLPPLEHAGADEIPRWGNAACLDAPLKTPRHGRRKSEASAKIVESIDFSDHKSPVHCRRQDLTRSKSISRSIYNKMHRSQCQSDGSLRHLMKRSDSGRMDKPSPNATFGDRAPRKPVPRSSSFRNKASKQGCGYDVDEVSLGTRTIHRPSLNRQSSITQKLYESIKSIPDVDQAPVIPSREGSSPRHSFSVDVTAAAYADFDSRRKDLNRSKSIDRIERTFFFQMKQPSNRSLTRPKTSSHNESITLVCTDQDRHTTVPNAA